MQDETSAQRALKTTRDSNMIDIKSALLETEPFQWSHENAALIVERDSHGPDTVTIVAGVPDGDWEHLLEQWLTAALIALPAAEIEDANIVETDLWEEGPTMATEIRLSLPG